MVQGIGLFVDKKSTAGLVTSQSREIAVEKQRLSGPTSNIQRYY